MNERVRKTLAEAIANSNSSLAELSRGAGRNHAYLQQFIERGVPKKLPEDVRMHVAVALGLSEVDLGAPFREEPRRLSEHEEWEEEQRTRQSTKRAWSRENYKPVVPGALPEIDVQLGAGQGKIGETLTLPLGGESYSGHAIVGEWLFPEAYLRSEINARPSNTLVMPVTGDSMEPTYRPGDRVLVDLAQDKLGADAVYVISDGESPPQIKRLQRVLFTKPVEVTIISDNPSMDKQTVHLDRLKIIGRVVGKVSRQ